MFGPERQRETEAGAQEIQVVTVPDCGERRGVCDVLSLPGAQAQGGYGKGQLGPAPNVYERKPICTH